jgi:hypothetical protein
MAKKKNNFCVGCGARTFLVIGGIISLILGYVLWMGIWNLEKVFALMLFIAGFFKLVWGLMPRP